jgi:hypothetical protein
MICINYVVTGQDVNDDMEMESTAYISYTLRLLYRFLFDNGFSKEKLNAKHLGLQVENHKLVCYQNLMFTEPFFIKIENYCIGDKIKIKSCFFNSKNECCAEVTKEVEWFDYVRKKVIPTPKNYFHNNPV